MKVYADESEMNGVAVHSRYRALRMAARGTVKDYINRAVSLSSDLRELDREATKDDLAITIFNGLRNEYRPFLLAL